MVASSLRECSFDRVKINIRVECTVAAVMHGVQRSLLPGTRPPCCGTPACAAEGGRKANGPGLDLRQGCFVSPPGTQRL
jgi:hypothetical protein